MIITQHVGGKMPYSRLCADRKQAVDASNCWSHRGRWVSTAPALREGIAGDCPADISPSFFDRAAKLLHEQGVPVHQRLDLLAFDLHDSDFANGIRATDHRLTSERALPKK
ncbi:hypothetical protein BKG83_23705 [Mycobacteroides chelonae]|nr:hypothetical protein BKG83_23705 [Mycobacteroides chelonae]PKQ59528.1 hypothetical protein B5566_03465 [Mycobacterium sp. MHSD3]